MKITVFGAGCVGLVQAAVLAEVGHTVCCIDLSEERIAMLNQGRIPIWEPGLERLVRENSEAGRLTFSTDGAAGVNHGKVLFMAVGTPEAVDGHADTAAVLALARTIGKTMTDAKVVATKSTVPVGTGDAIEAVIREELATRNLDHLDIDVVSNPEFLKEGSAVSDCMRPDRIIIGTDNAEVEELMRVIYAPFNRNRDRIMTMDRRSAELTKYAANSMLATKISFMNEIAAIADSLGADIEEVRRGIGADPRIGYHFIYAGAGFGGACFPKDVNALCHTARDYGVDPMILSAVRSRNDRQKEVLFGKIMGHYGGQIRGKTFAVWGLSFKPNTDDLREAPSRVLIEALWAEGAIVRAYDPKAMEAMRGIYGDRDDLVLTDNAAKALEGADALAIVTEWQEFKSPDTDLLKAQLTDAVIFDGRNLYEPSWMDGAGLVYYAIGRGRRIGGAAAQTAKAAAG